MRIAIDVRALIEGRHSGVEEYATQIIKGLVKIAPEHEFVFFYNSATLAAPAFLSELGKVVGYRFPNKIFNLCQYAFGWPKWDDLIVKQIGYRPDLFFVPNIRLLPVNRVPVVVTAHDVSYELFPEFYSIKHRVWHKLVKPKQLLHKADHVIAVSMATKEDIVRLNGVDEEKVSVIYSGVKRLEALSETQKRERRLPSGYVLYLGTMEPRKNIVSIIEAFASIADGISQDLVIAGETGWLMREVERAIEQSGIKDRIHRIGFVDEAEKYSLYQQADLFVYPSFYEGFGFPPLEALLAGTPVITSHNASLPEVVGDWAVMVNPYDVSELALVMKEMLTNPLSVDEKTRDEIKNKFSWDRAARQTLKIFDKVQSSRHEMPLQNKRVAPRGSPAERLDSPPSGEGGSRRVGVQRRQDPSLY